MSDSEESSYNAIFELTTAVRNLSIEQQRIRHELAQVNTNLATLTERIELALADHSAQPQVAAIAIEPEPPVIARTGPLVIGDLVRVRSGRYRGEEGRIDSFTTGGYARVIRSEHPGSKIRKLPRNLERV